MHYETHVDYLTLTMPARVEMPEVELWSSLVNRALAEGEKIGRRKLGRALGYTGEVAGPVFVGQRQDSSILRVSGVTASKIAGHSRPDAVRCTRVDLALTIWLDQDDKRVASKARDTATESREKNPVGLVRTITFIDGCGAGDTLYLGSRTSELFGRVYDKGRESASPEYTFAWRYEVEYKGAHAQECLAAWGKAVNKRAWELGIVLRWFADRGVQTPLPEQQGEVIRVEGTHGRTEPERVLEWLRTGVAPSVRRLLTWYDYETILSALGVPLEDPMDP